MAQSEEPRIEGLTGLKDMTPQQLLKECYEAGLLARHGIIEE